MFSYRVLSSLAAWILPLWLFLRQKRGKEDAKRIRERTGKASRPRPPGKLLWIHAASVGEANSVLLLIEKIRARFPHIAILLTTGTVTSARLMQRRLPKDVIHQYAPIDTPKATQRFIQHWKPQMAFWVESEFWPNLVQAAQRYYCFMCVINGRMSEKSFRMWNKFPNMTRQITGAFSYIFAQSEEDAARFSAMGAPETLCVGNLKYDAMLLPCDEAQLVNLANSIGERPQWLAASTHPREEKMIGETHALLAKKFPQLLTIVVPRHPQRGPEIATLLAPFGKVAMRSRNDIIGDDTAFYIADTLGELGLFYRLSDVVFMGGSLVDHGGQNPLEPARLACAILTGPHTYNFDAIYGEMKKNNLCLTVENPAQLAARVGELLENPPLLDAMQRSVKPWIESKGGATDRLLDILGPAFMVEVSA